MGNFGAGVLQGVSDLVQKKVDENHAEQEQRNAELRKGLWGIAYDPNQPEAVRQNAQDQLQKLYPTQKKPLQKFGEIFHGLAQHLGGSQQPDQGQPTPQGGGLATPQTPAPQSGATPTPTGPPPQLAMPQTPAPSAAQASQGASPGVVSAQLATPKTPAPITSTALQINAPPPAVAPNSNAFHLPPVATDAQLAAARAQLAKEAQDAETFKTNEQIRAHKAELENSGAINATQSTKERNDQIAAIEADPNLSDEDKRMGRLHVYGIPYQIGTLTTVHYQDKKGDWHPAQHDSTTGALVGMDKKPIDPTTVQDVRPEPPLPLKPTGELSDRTQAQAIVDDKSGKHTSSEVQAAKDYLKHVNAISQGTTVRIENAQNQAASRMTDDELRGLAQREITTGQRPAFGLGQSADRNQYNRVLAQEWTRNPDASSALAAYKAGSANLRQLSVLQGQIGSFDDAFKSDLQNARDASANVPRTSARRFNNFTQLMKSDWTDDPALAQLKVAAQTAVNQYARLVSSASGGGVSTDSARAEATALLDKAMAKGSFNAALDQMEIEAGNRVKGIQGQIDKQVKQFTPSPRGQQSLQTPDSKPKIKILSVQ